MTASLREAMMAHAYDEYGAKPEYLWEDTPDCGILRHENGKWFAVFMSVSAKSLHLHGDGKREVLNLKNTPERIEMLREIEGILPGFHMNKQHWITVLLDGTVPEEMLCLLMKQSYLLIGSKGRKMG